ncbi:MAG: DUF1080 domain-containing protein, partial [Bacteroidota bacterium]
MRALLLLLVVLAVGCQPAAPPDSSAASPPTSPAAMPLSSSSTDVPRASAWRQHDTTRLLPARVELAPVPPPTPAPADATILIPADGGSLDAWEAMDGSPAPWTIEGDAVVIAPGSGSIRTRQPFGDVQLHLEWKAAPEPEKTSQDRSNSGVMFFEGLYEVQILDTFDNATYPDGMAGAIYGQYPPLADALRPSDQWQHYDLFFRGPRFGTDGAVLEPARLTVLINGVLVQNNELLPGSTLWMQSLPYAPHPRRGKIVLQDHGSPVRFRNVWIRETPDRPAPPDGYAEIRAADVSDADLARLVGHYERGPGDL